MDGKGAEADLPDDVVALRARVDELTLSLVQKEEELVRLRESEKRLRMILENSPSVISLMEPTGRLLYVNHVNPPVTVETVLGTLVSAHLKPPAAEAFERALRRVVETGKPQIVEIDTIHDAQWDTHLVPLESEGQVVAVMGIGAEVTDRRRAEKALRRSEERLRVAADAARMGLWSWEANQDLLVVDAAFAAMVGLPEGTTQTSVRELLSRVHPEWREQVEKALAECAISGVLRDLEACFLLPDGSIRWLLASGKRREDDAAAPLGLIGGAFDITERKKLEEQLRHSQKMEAVGQLTAGIAHNFNNLLTAIIPSIQLARRSPGGSEGLADAEHAANRAAELVKQLMVFARRHLPVAKEPVDMRALVERTIGICRATFERSIVIEVSDTGASLAVVGEAGALEQMLLNILLNARDALGTVPKPDRAIRVGLGIVRATDASGEAVDWVRVRISDNGSGMTEEVRTRIFEPFFTTKGVGLGSGLGLATAYAIVTDHGGRLSCESRIGVGTTFSLLLPATHELPQSPSIPRRRDWAGKETILVIDDERLVRRAVRSVLEPHGYEVREAADGSSGFELFQRERSRIDLVLLDLSMPGIPGEAVLSSMLREQPTTRVVLFTGYQPLRMPPGAVAVLQKPFELEELLRVVRAVCDGTTMTRTGFT